MEILLVAQDVTWGGSTGDAIHLRELAGHLAARGHGVNVLARAGPELPPPTGVKVRSLRSRHNLALSLIRRPLVVREMLRSAREHPVDVVYSRGFGDVSEARAAAVLGIPLVFEVNGDAISERESQGARSYLSFERGWRVRSARAGFARARLVVTVTEALRDRLIREYGVSRDRLRVIPNAADVEHFRPIPGDEARRALGLPGDVLVVGFVGNLAPWQGVDSLVRAFRAISDRHAGSRLLVVGDGQERKGLEALAAKIGLGGRVTFTGAVPHEQVPTYVAAMDVCTAPMTRERLESGSSAIKIHEYLACARPVVASRIPGLEFVELEDVGRLVPPEDPEALAGALDEVLQDPSWRHVAGLRGRTFEEGRAGWPSVAAAVEGVLREVVGA